MGLGERCPVSCPLGSQESRVGSQFFGEAGQVMHRALHSEAREVAGPEEAQFEATGASQEILC